VSAVVSLGANLGDRMARLRCGLEVLAQHVAVTAVSPVYETAPVGVTDQPAYLNAVALLASDDPETVFVAAQAAELSQGRLRSRRWGPRTLDVDVISVDTVVPDDPRLTLPHPRAHERAFVLVPWLAVDSNATVPLRGTVRILLASLSIQDVRRVADPLPLPWR
jgi:2-amino-4-hydroxy-6-hydroxymethyldihydropteridine diphosphokinase